MRIFGFSAFTIFLLVLAFIIGGKNPDVVAKLPFVGGGAA